MMTSAAIGWQAELERVRLIRAFAAFFNQYDLLLTPCVPIAPFAAGHDINTPDASAYPEWYDWTPYTWVFNAAKLPGCFLSLGPECSRAAAGGATGSNAFSRGSCTACERYSRGERCRSGIQTMCCGGSMVFPWNSEAHMRKIPE